MPGLPLPPLTRKGKGQLLRSPCLSAKKKTKSRACLEPMNLNNPLNSFSWSCRMSRHLAAAPDLWAHTAGYHGYLRHLQEESHKHSVWASETITRKKSKRDPKQVCNNFQHSWATLRIDKSCLLIFRKKEKLFILEKTKQNKIGSELCSHPSPICLQLLT